MHYVVCLPQTTGIPTFLPQTFGVLSYCCRHSPQRYERHKEERLHERQKNDAAATAAKEACHESEEIRLMVLEERRSWDAYELNVRNHSRMIEQVKLSRTGYTGTRPLPAN